MAQMELRERVWMKPVVRTYISASMFTHMRNLSLCQKLQQHRQN